MDDLKRQAQQFLGVMGTAAQGASSYIPEVANFTRAAFVDPVAKRAINAGAALSGQKAEDEKEAEAAARKAEITRLSNLADPSKYQKVRKADGGFAFFDPTGKEIDINRYTQMTGQRRVDVLKDSENPIDQSYINDYSNMQEFANAIYNNDSMTVEAFVKQNPSLKGRTPQDIMALLIRKYPHMYGRGKYQETFKNRNNRIFSFNTNAPTGGVSLSGLGG